MILLLVMSLIAMTIFAALYIDETKHTQETYRIQYKTNINHVVEDINSYQNGEGALDLRYRHLVNDMGSANSFIFLIEGMDEEKVIINEINACLLLYPEQMQEKENLEKLKSAMEDIAADLDKGYDETKALVDSIDKQGL